MIIHKTITVGRPADVAFKLFADQIGSWWPSHTHSFIEGGNATCALEPKVGGRLYETNPEGKEYTIGEVTAYEPGKLVAFSWNHGEGKGVTQVEVRFTAEGDHTRIDLKHSGWESLSEPKEAAGYDSGWDTVLAYYLVAANEQK